MIILLQYYYNITILLQYYNKICNNMICGFLQKKKQMLEKNFYNFLYILKTPIQRKKRNKNIYLSPKNLINIKIKYGCSIYHD